MPVVWFEILLLIEPHRLQLFESRWKFIERQKTVAPDHPACGIISVNVLASDRDFITLARGRVPSAPEALRVNSPSPEPKGSLTSISDSRLVGFYRQLPRNIVKNG